jgi:Gpi18-like mannosyltransferase
MPTTDADRPALPSPAPSPLLRAAPWALLVVAVAVRWLLWPHLTPDVQNFNVPWLEHLRREGFVGLSTTDANYNPPYLYLLLIAVKLFPGASAFDLVKAVSVAFEVVLAASVFLLVRGPAGVGRRTPQATLAAAGVLLVPTVALNAAGWGQCDAIYASFILLGLAAADRGREGLATAGLTTAVAFKLQAAFGGPAALANWWVSRRRVRDLVIGVVVYAVWMVPMILAGRPAAEALTTYLRQADFAHELALGAPNLWTILKYALPGPTGYRIGVLVGTAIVLAAVAVFVPFAVRELRRDPARRMELFFTAYFAVPFLLPKMHDRYFFAADVLSFVLAVRDRRWVPVAVLVQIGSLSAYIAYLEGVRWPRPFGILANCLVMLFLWRHWRGRQAAAAPLLGQVRAARA